MFFLDNLCETDNILKVIYFIKQILFILMIIIPILLILLVAIDFIKVMIKGDGKTETSLVVKRLISAVALFLVPYMVNAVMLLLGEFGVNFSDCYNNANQEFILNSSIHEEMSPFAASYTEVTYVDLSNAKKNN